MSTVSQLKEGIYTLYLFTASDLTAVLVPQTFFAVFTVASGQFASRSSEVLPSAILSRLPHAVIWIWLQLLVLDLSNQRQPGSITEDLLNKPWRPIPAKRVTAESTRQLLVISIVGTFAASMYLSRGVTETLVLFALNWAYNDLGLCNGHWAVRNLMNGLGITSIGLGAIRVICGPCCELDEDSLCRWSLLCASMITTTIHAQDLYDQEGDRARGRQTAPLVLGDAAARWSVAISVSAWSVTMPLFTGMGSSEHWLSYLVLMVPGAVVATRVLTLRGVREDRATFKTWVLWTMCLYALPLTQGWDIPK